MAKRRKHKPKKMASLDDKSNVMSPQEQKKFKEYLANKKRKS